MSFISIDNLSYAYQDETIFSGANLKIKAGEIVGVFGPSGVGKSTLLQLLCGNLLPQAGRVRSDGEMTLLSQDLALLPHLSPVQNCLLPALFKGLDAKMVASQATSYLKALDLQDMLATYCKSHPQNEEEKPFRLVMRCAAIW